ncbi:RHS repeat-associated core domain-containing protein [Burkholderia ubonensis]|uniref:RHS repeat-associated core domain-containing protein n=1 Tax=Burkholderia ubonensis TaxID=101571 RepID=UPI000A0FFC7C|nr:RHS repeat-associated core domain-containing protein [Burkholderia ubonensis]
MALLAVKHLDPVVGIDVHSVLVTPGTPPVFLPHPHVGFMLDLREYVEAAKGVVGSIAMTIVEEKVIEYIEDHPDEVKKLEDQADAAMRKVDDMAGWMSGKLPDIEDNPVVAEGGSLAKEGKKLESRISNDLGSNVGAGGSSGRPIFVNGLLRATAGTHAYHVPGLHFPLGEAFVPPPAEDPEPSNDGESFMGSKTVLANNDPMSYMALQALSCWSIGMEPPSHNGAHTERTYPSMPSSVMLPIPVGRPVLVGGAPVMNMAAAAVGLFKAFRGSGWAKNLADKLHLKPGFLRCTVLGADPVDMITGEVVMRQRDFTLSGRLPLVWVRHYASHDTWRGAVGVGWRTPADIRLELMRHEGSMGVAAYFLDHATAFDAMPHAAGWPVRVYDWQYGYALYRQDDQMVLRARGIEYEFSLPAQWQRALEGLAEGATAKLPVMRMADLNGNAWVFEREPDQSLSRLVELKGEEATGRMIECEAGTGDQARGHASLLTALTLIDAGGCTHPLVGYEHDRSGNLVAALDAMSQPHHFAYDDGHRMVRHTSARGISFYYSHRRHDDGGWRVEHAWGDNGIADYRFVYDVANRETRMTDSLGYMTILQANQRGMPVAKIDPLGGVWSYRYDTLGRASAKTDPAGRTTFWEYDAYGNLLAQTLPDGRFVRVGYNADHRLVCMSAPGDRQWRYTWDERGNLLEQTSPIKITTRYEYDRHGQLVARTGPSGAVTRFAYDRDGNLDAVADALGHTTRYTYDVRANIVQIVNALGQVSRYEYDRNGNLTWAIEPGGGETFCRYDAGGNVTHYRDPNGQVTQLEYSALGHVRKRLTPHVGVIEYQYDTEGKLVGVINERGELYRLKRDALGRIVEEVDYWGQSRRYVYGPKGELLRSIDPLGQAIDYEWDMLGRLVKKRVRDPRQPAGDRTEMFSYDRRGNLIVAENPDSRVEWVYDALGRVVEERQGDDFVITHAYDAAGNRIERRTRLNAGGEFIAHTVRYRYDPFDVVSSVQIDEATPISFERDALGQIRVEHLGTELRHELSYTSEGALAKQALFSGTSLLFASEYAYDANGEMTEKRDSQLGVEHYQYDPVGRLTGHLDPTGKLHRFLYDPAGDLLKTRIRRGNQTGAFGQDTWIREGEHDGCYYAFDCIGNLVSKQDPQQELMLRWDGDGLLIETLTVRRAPADAVDSGGTLSIRTRYGYDVFHRRTKKITEIQRDVDSRAGSASSWSTSLRTSCYFWEGDAMVGEFAAVGEDIVQLPTNVPSSARTTQFQFPSRPVDTRDALPGLTHLHGETREWIYYPGTFFPLAGMRRVSATDTPRPPASDTRNARHATGDDDVWEDTGPTRAPSEMYYFHSDPNGAPTRITDPLGVVVWAGNYAAWGTVARSSALEEFNQPLRFQGQYFDAETGLHYNRYRYYDSHVGIFVSQDPLGIWPATNIYRYANNTISWADPMGLDSADDTFRKIIQIMAQAGNKAVSWGATKNESEAILEQFAIEANDENPLLQGRYRFCWQPASIGRNGFRVPTTYVNAEGKEKAYPRSGILDLGIVDTWQLSSGGRFARVVAGIDITVNETKPLVSNYYKHFFGDIPILDIRPNGTDDPELRHKILPCEGEPCWHQVGTQSSWRHPPLI